MKKNALIEIKQLGIKEIVAKILASKKEFASLVLDKNMKKLKDTKVISKKKKDIAQMQTIVNQKRLIVDLEKTEEKSEEVEVKPIKITKKKGSVEK